MPPRIDIVIPLRAKDFERFSISLASYRYYWWIPYHIYLFCRPEERSEASCLFDASDVTVLDKREICGPAFEISGGWFRAQATKLAAAHLVGSTFYLPSDPDIITTRKVTESFFRNGKAPYYPRRKHHESVTPCEPERFYSPQAIEKSWRPMAKLLGVPMPDDIVPRMVTPLHTKLVLDALALLSDLGGNRDWREMWRELVGSMRPSDFALYYLVSHVRNDALDKHHYPKPFLGKNVRTAEEAKQWRPSEVMNNQDFFAMAVEAKSGISPRDLRERLRRWIPVL